MRQLIKEYFSFTKKERIAIIGLVVLVLLAYLLPYFIKPPGRGPSEHELAEFRKLEQQLSGDKNKGGKNNSSDGYAIAHGPPGAGSSALDDGAAHNGTGYGGAGAESAGYDGLRDNSKSYDGLVGNNADRDGGHLPERLFYFDPNTVSAEGWKQLGLRSKTIGTILKYLSKGGHFYEAIDLKKIYGLKPQEYARLERYIRISKPAHEVKNFSNGSPASSKYPGAHRPVNAPLHGTINSAGNASFSNPRSPGRGSPPAKYSIDINTADTTGWISLPGIGSKLAVRIVTFRQKLGGFYSAEQLREIYGLPDSTFQKILPVLNRGNYSIKKISINTADIETLKQHPYIKWNIASAIVRYREQHGPFVSLEALLQIAVITPDIYKKVSPYLVIASD